MRFKLTLLLLLANIAVFYVLWRLDRPVPVELTPPIIPHDFTDVDRIVIEDHTKPDVPKRVLVRQRDDSWRLAEPMDWPADDNAVRRMMNELLFPGNETTFPISELAKSDATLDNYGLQKPALEITLTAGTRQQKLLVGSPTAFGNNVFIRNPADGLIRAVPQELLESLDVPLDQLRDPRPFTLRYANVQSLAVRLGAAQGTSVPAQDATSLTRFVKDGQDWRLESPSQSAADTQLVNRTIIALLSLSAERFLSPAEQDLARQGLANPFMRVELKGDTRQTLLLGERVPNSDPPEYYAKLEDSPTVFIVSAPIIEVLRNAQDTLREHHFFNFTPEKVTAITLRFTNGGELRLQKNETGDDPWKILTKDSSGAPITISADTAIVQSLLLDLRRLEAVSFTRDNASKEDLATFGLDPPQWTVTLNADKPVTVLLGVRGDGRRYAKLDSSPSVYEIGPQIFGKLSIDPLSFRSRTLDTLPPGSQVVSLKLSRVNPNLSPGETLFDYTLSPQKPEWTDVLKDEPLPVRTSVQNLVSAVRQFPVASYQQDKFIEHYLYTDQLASLTEVPWVYRLDARVMVPAAGQAAGTNQTMTYFFSRRLGGSTQFGGTREPQPPAVFRLTTTMINDLAALTLARQPPANVENVLQQINQPIDPRASATPTPGATSPAPAVPATSTTP